MKYRLLCLLAAIIWGFAFVAQVVGMDTIGPYTFNGIRFLIGSITLLPLIRWKKSKTKISSGLFFCYFMCRYSSFCRCHITAGSPPIYNGFKSQLSYIHLYFAGSFIRSISE